MARRLTTLTAVLLLTGIPGLGQIIIPGVGYPGGGGGYPGGRRNPQQNPNPQPSAEPTNTSMVGILRKIEDKDVIIEDDNQTITTIAVTGSTKLRDTTGKTTNIGDFQPGDHVRIETKQEHNNANLAYRALSMTMVREGTMDEHAAASQASDDPTHPITKPSGNSSSASSASSNDPNRPVLHRASGADSSSDSSSSSDDSDPDRPRLRRASSSGGDSTNSSSTASSSSSNSSSDDDDPDRPRLHRAASSADSSAPAQINPDSSATVAPPRPSSSGSSSSGSSSNGSATTVADARPSIHASDTNGVTQLPSAPAVGPAEQPETASSGGLRVPNRLPSSGDDVIDQARRAGFSYSETLPNYVVKQYTTRYETQAARGGHTSWQALDEVTADVLEVDGVEQYKNILVNGRAPREDVSKTGSWSSGEFSSLLLDILSPVTHADFHGKRSTTIANRAAFRYDFSVEQSNSHWHVESESQTYMPSYTGTIWIDKQTYRALRIELAADRMPSSFPLDTVESAVDYDFVQIGEGKYLLPVHSEALSCGRGTNDCSRNVIEFRNYRKFSADTSITFDTNN